MTHSERIEAAAKAAFEEYEYINLSCQVARAVIVQWEGDK
jgi:hypothetical protein